MKLIPLFLFLVIGMNANAEISLEKPISVVLSDSEVAEYESMLRKGNFASNDFKDVLVFEGILIAAKNIGGGEKSYRFKVSKTLKLSSGAGKSTKKQIEVIAPEKTEDGGVNLKIGKLYRVGAPLLPDRRYGIWRGVVIELKGKSQGAIDSQSGPRKFGSAIRGQGRIDLE